MTQLLIGKDTLVDVDVEASDEFIARGKQDRAVAHFKDALAIATAVGGEVHSTLKDNNSISGLELMLDLEIGAEGSIGIGKIGAKTHIQAKIIWNREK